MATKSKPSTAAKKAATPPQEWLPPVLLGWLVPGGGHFYLKRWNHGGLLLFSVLGMFVFGLMMRGRMFVPEGGSLFNAIVTYGGYAADLASGLPYFLSVWLGYEQPYLAQPQADYGTKFLVCAGLLNILAIVDAYEIATGEKA
ncbi:MAG: hypothetical protein H6509_10695 [Bryobacterales bacterium]|nr:hypothetical protein [Bryobacterales bacterium]